MTAKTRVLIVDDSALVRKLLTEILHSDPSLEVVGAAADPYIAREKIKKLNPDVITLDVEMPRMDGITFLKNLMRLRPMPVVMVSSLTHKGADVTLQALELGAVDWVSKPKIDLAHTLEQYTEEIVTKVKIAAQARIQRGDHFIVSRSRLIPPRLSADAVLKHDARPRHFKMTERVIAVGASTGGTEAIKELLLDMPSESPAILITQHMPEAFTASFARRLNDVCALNVLEASDGTHVLPGHAYIAPGNRHLLLIRDGARYHCRLDDGPQVNRHRPSVDVLFRSVARHAGPNAVGAILTGMGDDGARGLKEMREAGACTIAQDEATSVVWGMPGSAVKHGGVDQVLPLGKIAGRILELAEQ